MTQITKNAKFTDLLQVGQILTVTASGGGSALIQITSPSGAFLQSSTSGTATFGPYSFDQQYVVTALAGFVDVSETISDQAQTGYTALTDAATVNLPVVNAPLAAALADKAPVDPTSVSLSGAYTLTNADDRKTYTCTTALTVSVPTGLSPAPSTIHYPPATGNLTLTPTGGATLNGSTSSLTRTLTNNRLGVYIVPSPYTANDYSVSGS